MASPVFDSPGLTYVTDDFDGAETVSAVDPTDSSNNVYKTTKATGAEPWAGTKVVTPNFELSSSTQKMSMLVYSTTAGLSVRLAFSNPLDRADGLHVDAETTVASGWQKLTFDFATSTGIYKPSSTYSVLSFNLNEGSVGSGEVMYWDDLKEDFSVSPDPPPKLGAATIALFPQDKSISVEWNVTLPLGDNRVLTGGYLIVCNREYNLYSVMDLSVCEAEEKSFNIITLDNKPLVNGNKYTVQYVQLMNDGTQISSPSRMCIPVARPAPLSIVGHPTLVKPSSDGTTNGSKFNVSVVVDNSGNSGYLGMQHCYISFKMCQVHEDYPPLVGYDDPNLPGGINYTNDIVTRVLPVTNYGVNDVYILENIPKGHYTLMAVYSNQYGPSLVSNMPSVFVYEVPSNVTITALSGEDEELHFDVACAVDNTNAPIHSIVVSLVTMPDNLPVSNQNPKVLLAGIGPVNYNSNAFVRNALQISGKGKFTGLTNGQAYKVMAIGKTAPLNPPGHLLAADNDDDVMVSLTVGHATAVPARFTLSTVAVNSTSNGGITFTGYTITENLSNTFINHRYSVSSNSPPSDPFSASNISTLTNTVDDSNFFDGLEISVVMKDVVTAYDFWTLPPLETSGSEKLWVHGEQVIKSTAVDILPKVVVQTESGHDTELRYNLSCNPVFKINSVPDTSMIVHVSLYTDSDSLLSSVEFPYSASLPVGQSGWTVEGDNLRGRGSFSGLTNGSVYYIKVWATTVPPSPNTTPSQSQFTKSYGVPCKLVQGQLRFSYDYDGAPTGLVLSDPTGTTLSTHRYDLVYKTDGTNIEPTLSQTKVPAQSFTIPTTYLQTGATAVATQFDQIPSDISAYWEFPFIIYASMKYYEHPRYIPDKLSATLKRYDPPSSVYNLQVTEREAAKLNTITWNIDFTVDDQPDVFEVKLVDTSTDSEIYNFSKNLNSSATSGVTVEFNQNILLTGVGPYTLSVTSMKYDREGDYLMKALPTSITVYKLAELPNPDPCIVEQVDEWKQQVSLSAAQTTASGYTSINPIAYVTIRRGSSVLTGWNNKEVDFAYQYAAGTWTNSNVYQLGGTGAPTLVGASSSPINGWSYTTATWQTTATNLDGTQTATYAGAVLTSTNYNGPITIETTYGVDSTTGLPNTPIVFSLINPSSGAVIFSSTSTVTGVNQSAKQITGTTNVYPMLHNYAPGTWTNSNVYQLGGTGAPTLVGTSAGWSFTTATWQATATNLDGTKTATYTGAVLTSSGYNGPVTIETTYGVDSNGLPNTPIVFSLINPSGGAVIFSSTSTVTGVNQYAKQITGSVNAYSSYAAGTWTNSNVYQLGGTGAPTLVGASIGRWSLTTATWQTTTPNLDGTQTATYTGATLTSNAYNGPVTVETTYSVVNGLPNGSIAFSLKTLSGALIFSSMSTVTAVDQAAKQITGAIAAYNPVSNFTQTLTNTLYGDELSITFKNRALFSDYPFGSSRYVYSSGVAKTLTVMQLQYPVEGLEFDQGTGTNIDQATFSWTALSNVNAGATLAYSYRIDTLAEEGSSVSLSSSDISTSNGKSSFVIRVKLGVAQRLTLSLVTTFDNLSAPTTSDFVDYTATYDDLSITSPNTTKVNLDTVNSLAYFTLAYGLNQPYWTQTQVQFATRALTDANYSSLAVYGSNFSIAPGVRYKVKLVVTAIISNGDFTDIEQTDESELDVVWVLPPVPRLISSTNSANQSELTFSVDPKGGTVTGLFIVAVPGGITTSASSIVFTRAPPTLPGTAYTNVEGTELKQIVPYDVGTITSTLIGASNEAGIGYEELGLFAC